MINPKELRIGNYVQGDPLNVPAMSHYHDGVTAITGYGIYAIQMGLITSFNPIPLLPNSYKALV